MFIDIDIEKNKIMPIMSYLAYASHGKSKELADHLRAIPGCEVTHSENKNVLILVTDTQNDTEEQCLQEKLKTVESLDWLAMTFGHE